MTLTDAQKIALKRIDAHFVTPTSRPRFSINQRTLDSLISKGLVRLGDDGVYALTDRRSLSTAGVL